MTLRPLAFDLDGLPDSSFFFPEISGKVKFSLRGDFCDCRFLLFALPSI